ncbi:uncharacterized protein LOC130284088 isoform X2 [Hyla sarda]|nr:uncharacterized protein LOC130284088 isoform X2 [Hyla sarda]
MKLCPAVDGVCRFLYEQLVILFHDHECGQCQRTYNILQYSALPLCQSVDAVLSHMKYCRAGMSCQIPSCSSVRVIVSHWKVCRNKECPVALNLSKDRKGNIQLLLQAEVKSFSAMETTCQHINKQLILLFLKHDCEACVEIHYQHYSDLPLCHSVDAMLSHMKFCRAGMSCKVPGCPAARVIISHWKVCKDQYCPVIWNLSKDRKPNIQKQICQKAMLPSVWYFGRDSAKNFRQTLFVMFHAWSCIYRQKSGGFGCGLPQCQTMKALLRHTETCVEGPLCKDSRCIAIRFLFIHYMICIRRDCKICWPVRSVIKQLCGTDDPSTSRPVNQMYEGIPVTTTTVSNDTTDLWFSALLYKCLLTKEPLIGPPLFQRENQQKNIRTRRWEKRSRVLYKWMRKPPCRWRHYRSIQLRMRGNGRLSSLSL